MPNFPKEFLRAGATAVMRLGLRLSSRPYLPPVKGLLVIAPHADDETLGCGGLIAAQGQAGRPVEIVFLTDSAGSPPVAGLAETRRGEALAALEVLGVPAGRVHFLNLADGTLDRLPAGIVRETVDRLARLIRDRQPAEVLAPYRLGGSTEHTAAWHLAVAALAGAGGGRLLEYPIWAWWNPWRLRSRLGQPQDNFRLALGSRLAVKCRALACHQSQVRPIPPGRDPALPVSLARACCGPTEFFFASTIPPGQSRQP